MSEYLEKENCKIPPIQMAVSNFNKTMHNIAIDRQLKCGGIVFKL